MENRSRSTRQQPPGELEPRSREKVETLLRELGAHEEVVVAVSQRVHEDADVRTLVTRFRTFARENPAVVMGALSAIVLAGAITAERALAKPAKAKKKNKKSTKTAKTKAKSAKGRATTARTLIEPHPGDKRYVRRDKRGRIKESVDVGRSLAADRKQHSKKRAKRGHGDEGDR